MGERVVCGGGGRKEDKGRKKGREGGGNGDRHAPGHLLCQTLLSDPVPVNSSNPHGSPGATIIHREMKQSAPM